MPTLSCCLRELQDREGPTPIPLVRAWEAGESILVLDTIQAATTAAGLLHNAVSGLPGSNQNKGNRTYNQNKG